MNIGIRNIMMVMVLLISCKPKPQLMQAGDQELTIKLMKLKDKADPGNTLSYQARLIPGKKKNETGTNETKQDLLYRMDSTFYIIEHHKKIYASLVQPVANGLKDSYEYLLQFESDSMLDDQQIEMIYQDKYISKRTYRLKATGE